MARRQTGGARHEEAGRDKAAAREAKRLRLREGRKEREKQRKDPEIGKPGPEKS